MGINSPSEITDIWINNGVKKAGLPVFKMLILGILAGVYIGFGSGIYVLATSAGGDVFQSMIGSILIAFLFANSGLFVEAAGERAALIAASKTSMPFIQAVLRGIGCNILVVLACWMQASAKEMIGKIFAIWFPIAAFVFLGFEHSVANMTYIPLGIFLGADVSWGSMFTANLIPVTIGNLIGGAVIVPCAYYYAYKK